ncbi:B- and T-lymphocyte attenuator-like [Salvelinus fontinalis]|uniref:B- and T-lymphocyte attenuator-like n=1 Tax=Salvelinus fontinalis TaxID=8038 RepID=UPI0024861B54|nr:B- and T-lymphocyte attenuator-like [Salvelinus fontinalis]
MGPRDCWSWTCLPLTILVVLLFPQDAHGQENATCAEIRLKRNTVWRASSGDHLKINCSVAFCTNSPSPVSWCKLGQSNYANDCFPVNTTGHIETQWRDSTNSRRDKEGTSFLIFTSISVDDAGLYRCNYGPTVSHSINVTVSERVKDTTDVYQKNETTNSTLSQRDSFLEWVWPYVYSSAGIMVFVIVVITISMLSMHGCKDACPARKSREEDQTENQYMAIPMTQQAFPRPNPQPHHRQSIRSHQAQDQPQAQPRPQAQAQAQPTPPPDCIYDNAPTRGPRRTHPAPVQAAANQVAVSVDSDDTYSSGKEKEEESDIMYAALNHQVKPRAAPRPAQPQEEGSEYAAIRVS